MKRLFSKYPALFVGVFTLFWVVMERISAASGVSLYQVVWTRYAVHLAFLAVVFGPRHGLGLVRSSHLGRQIVRSLCMLGMPLCFIWALPRMSGQDMLGVFWTVPVLVIAIAVVTRGPSGGVLTFVAAVIGFVGVVLICKPDAGVFRPAAIFALGMALCLALYMVMSRAMRHEAELTKLVHTALWVFVPLTFVLPFFWQTPTLRGLVAMSVIGVMSCGMLYALDRAVERVPPAFLAPVLYTQLAWDLLLRWSLHDATPHARTLIGTLFLFAAAGLAVFWSARQVPLSQPSLSSRL